MKKIFCIILLASVSSKCFAQLSKKMAKDTLIWTKDIPLAPGDFKGKKKDNAAGMTYSGLLLYPKESKGTINFYVEAIFLKSKSFVVDSSVYTLKHEQLHFDITEVNARRLRQKIKERDFKKVKNIREQVQKMYDKAASDMNREKTKYDTHTENGMNAAKQKVWAENIANELKGLEQFESTEINIAE